MVDVKNDTDDELRAALRRRAWFHSDRSALASWAASETYKVAPSQALNDYINERNAATERADEAAELALTDPLSARVLLDQ